jgi:hypothetical protein
MYIIFDPHHNILQIGLSSLKDLGLQKGFYISPDIQHPFSGKISGIYFINIPVKINTKEQTSDLRIKIYSQRKQKIIIFAFYIFNKVWKNCPAEPDSYQDRCGTAVLGKRNVHHFETLYKFIKNNIFKLLIVIFLFYKSYIFFEYKTEIEEKFKTHKAHITEPVPQSDIKKTEQLILSHAKSSLFEKDYFKKPLPIIKGIDDFFILPFSSQVSDESVPREIKPQEAYLIVPFKKAYLYENDKKVHLFSSKKECVQDNISYYIYPISSNYAMALFSKEDMDQKSKTPMFYYFSKNSYREEEICPAVRGHDI